MSAFPIKPQIRRRIVKKRTIYIGSSATSSHVRIRVCNPDDSQPTKRRTSRLQRARLVAERDATKVRAEVVRDGRVKERVARRAVLHKVTSAHSYPREPASATALTSFSWPGQSSIVALPVLELTVLICSSPAGCWNDSACGGTFGTGSFWFVTCAKFGI